MGQYYHHIAHNVTQHETALVRIQLIMRVRSATQSLRARY